LKIDHKEEVKTEDLAKMKKRLVLKQSLSQSNEIDGYIVNPSAFEIQPGYVSNDLTDLSKAVIPTTFKQRKPIRSTTSPDSLGPIQNFIS